MINFGEFNVQITLTVSEIRKLVELINIAEEYRLAVGEQPEPLVDEVSGLYFQLMESLKADGNLGAFEPER